MSVIAEPRVGNVVQELMRRANVRWWDWHRMPNDIERAWAEWNDAPELVKFLLELGFPFADVLAPLAAVASYSPTLAERVKAELRWGNNLGLYNATCVMCEYVPEDQLVAVYKGQFPLQAVAEKLMSKYGEYLVATT